MPRKTKKQRENAFAVARAAGSRRYFTYARVSSQEQSDRDLSIPAQTKAIREFALRHGLEIAEEFIDVESAKDPGRTNFTLMIERVRKDPAVAGILSHKVDRLARNLRDWATIADLRKTGISFLFVTEHFDDNSTGELSLGIRILFAKHYLDNLSEEARKGLNERMSRGLWSFFAPIGYRNFERRIEIDRDRAPFVRRAFEWYATGEYSVGRLADKLYKEGLRSRGNRRWPEGTKVPPGAVHKMLRNPFYHGVMLYKGEQVKGTHQPLIDRSLFGRVQVLLNDWGRPKVRRKEFTFRGFFKCGECGRTITAEIQKGHVYYRCTKGYKVGAGKCGQRYIREEDLDRQIAQVLKTLELDDTLLGKLRSALKESHKDEQEYRDAMIDQLNRLHTEVQRRQDALLNRLLDDTIPDEVYRQKFNALQDEKLGIEAKIESHRRANEAHTQQMENLLNLAQTVHRVFLLGGPERKRDVLKVVLSNGVINGKTAVLNLNPPFEVLANRANYQTWLRG